MSLLWVNNLESRFLRSFPLRQLLLPEGKEQQIDLEVFNFTGAGGVALSMYNTDEVMSQSENQNADVSVEESESSVVVRRRSSRMKSEAWNHFDKLGTKAVCRHCSMELATGPNLGTTHLRRHIKDVCEKISEEERQKFGLGKTGDLFGTSNYKFNPELTRSLMTLLFIDAEIPFSVIESRFWEATMRSLRPEYKAVGRQTLRNDCVEVFNKGLAITLEEFKELDSCVSFTADIWTSSVNLGYLVLTAHYIDKNFNFQKKIIGFRQMSYPHSGPKVNTIDGGFDLNQFQPFMRIP